MSGFQGYTDETFEFFMAIRFNNNRAFFHANRDWYVRAVREPSLLLSQALGDVVEDINPELERRPYRTLSHINRDIRFAADKSPYRDFLWLSFRYNGEEKGRIPELYFELSDEGASYGMGFYRESRELMNALRRRIETEPQVLRDIWAPLEKKFVMTPQTDKRMHIPETVPEDLRLWYSLRSFYITAPIGGFDLIKSPALADELIRCFSELKPLYQYILNAREERSV